MPRYARLHAPGALIHVIARFVNHRFLLAGERERQVFLERVPAALARADWAMHAYALMSSHIHLALIAGEEPAWRWLKPLHTGLAGELNRLHSAFGPVFAQRPTTVIMPPGRLGELAAYLHNNPVRAGIVTDASASGWTSHRAWTGAERAPTWLRVDEGLRLAGFGTGQEGRTAFDLFVRSKALQGRDAQLSDLGASPQRVAVRARVRLPLELASSTLLGVDDARRDLLLRGPSGPPRWDGDLLLVLRAVEARLGVSISDMRTRRRTRRLVRARRLVALTAVTMLRREVGEAAAALAVSSASVSYLLRAPGDLAPLARAIAGDVAAGAGAGPLGGSFVL